MFWKNKGMISSGEREQEFLWVEWMPTVANAEPWQFSHYVPTPMNKVKKDTWISLRELTQAKRNHGMYPIQKIIGKVFWSNKSNHA
jgi:hypothetical protein